MNRTKKSALRLSSSLLPGRIQEALVSWFSKPLKPQLCGKLTDEFLELLLGGMDLAFALSRSYRRNIQDFRATYVFKTRDSSVGVSAVFDNGDMRVDPEARPFYQALVCFRDPPALWSFLLAKDQDILDSLLANAVDVEGNLNYIYKFGYLARDLTRRLGLA